MKDEAAPIERAPWFERVRLGWGIAMWVLFVGICCVWWLTVYEPSNPNAAAGCPVSPGTYVREWSWVPLGIRCLDQGEGPDVGPGWVDSTVAVGLLAWAGVLASAVALRRSGSSDRSRVAGSGRSPGP